MTIAPWLTDLLAEEIDRTIDDDARTTPGTFLGWPKNRIFRDVIGGGQADFDAAVGHLSGDDRALLYARYNQRRHLDELTHAFSLLLESEQAIARPTVIDIGCGPFTAGLAFASVFGENAFRYFGVDRAGSMLRLARRLEEAAEARSALHPRSSVWFGNDLAAADFGPVRGEWTIVVASYLLASPTLDVEELVADILVTLDRVGPGPVAVLYTNSALPFNRAKFPAFLDGLRTGGFDLFIEGTETFDDTDKRPTELHYALIYRQARTILNII
ncbi:MULTISPECIES: class I SAM-dependent methyltransferase [unclassified Caballeronia]|uniref:class I SAM-dependent methyltransferase n=1 Tax=unclassified Caballeronia TaxID=2646786 RepID=UPI0020285557|nr:MULTISPECIES: class I SAM-dependent methyltransferase [unclassified Caballeronia]MDR5766148.1 class I SAM-dependent methyltransferase [Caballeronia sp. LZ028]